MKKKKITEKDKNVHKDAQGLMTAVGAAWMNPTSLYKTSSLCTPACLLTSNICLYQSVT